MAHERYRSLSQVHRVYWRISLHHGLELLLATISTALLALHLMFSLDRLFGLQPIGINVLAVALAAPVVLVMYRQLRAWRRGGMRLSTFFRRWEGNHPEVADRASLLMYAEDQAKEIERLGYSTELIAADDAWLIQHMERHFAGVRPQPSKPMTILFLVTFFLTLLIAGTKSGEVMDQGQRLLNAMWVREITHGSFILQTPSEIEVERGKGVRLTATALDGLPTDSALVHIASTMGWQTITAQSNGDTLWFDVPAVRQPLAYYFSSSNVVSNRGKVTPLDPPRLQNGTLTITPPLYTGLSTEVTPTLRPVSVPEGSEIVVQAEASAPLVSAMLHWGIQNRPIQVNGAQFEAAFESWEPAEFSFTFIDEKGLTGKTPHYAVTPIADVTPAAEIESPAPDTTIPASLVQRVRVHVRDDYRLTQIVTVHEINETGKPIHQLLWEYTDEAAAQVGSSTDFYLLYDWDLSSMNLFPGDELSFYVEVWDNDALHGPKRGRSTSHLIRFPSLSDLLADLDESENKQVEDLEDLVDNQKQISEEIKETVDQISNKIQTESGEPNQADALWTEKQELERLKDRQQELVEQAKKVEENLKQYEESIDSGLNDEQKQQQGFTPDTVEKMARIRELMNEMIDEDSRQMLKNIENTIQQLSQEVTPEQLQQMQFSVDDFEKQLDRTLSMLENTFQARQLNSLQEMAQELAQRQDHLERQTDKLSEEEKDLQAAEAQLNEEKQQAETSESPQGDPAASEQETGNSESAQSPNQEETQKALAEKQAALEKKREELENQRELLAERQKKLEKDTQQLMDNMKKLQESLAEKNPQTAQQLQNSLQQMIDQQLMMELTQASALMEQGQTQQAQSHQQNAEAQLQQLAQQLQNQMSDMGMQSMQQDLATLGRLIDRGLFLSEQMEPLALSDRQEIEAQRAILRAQAFVRELRRIGAEWQAAAQTNPFMSRDVARLLSHSDEEITRAIQASQVLKWVARFESRQSLAGLNTALYRMMQDQSAMQQQMAQASMDDMQQQLQQMISQQQGLNQMLRQLRQMGDAGQKLLERFKQMAQQQAMIRKEVEKMMQQFRNANQLRNQMQGIYDEMREVENMLEDGRDSAEVEKKQDHILTRLLEAGTFQEKDEYGKRRKAETAVTGKDATSPEGPSTIPLHEKAKDAAFRPDSENIPLMYRQAIKAYYTRLSERLAE